MLDCLDGAADDPGEIVSIHFGHKKFLNYKKLLQIALTAKKGQALRIQQSHCQDKKKKEILERKIDELKLSVMLLVRDYKNVDPSATEGDIKCAYVVFKSMEGAERCM